MDPRHKSRAILEGPDRAPARTYFKAVGYSDEDLTRPLVGVAHCWIERGRRAVPACGRCWP
jgi:dihydroxy-acid dehydratase